MFVSSTAQCGRLLEVLQRLTCTTVCTHTTPDNHWLVGWLVVTLLLGGDEQGSYVCITPCAHAALLVSISGPVDVKQYSGTASRRTWKTPHCPSHFPWHPTALLSLHRLDEDWRRGPDVNIWNGWWDVLINVLLQSVNVDYVVTTSLSFYFPVVYFPVGLPHRAVQVVKWSEKICCAVSLCGWHPYADKVASHHLLHVLCLVVARVVRLMGFISNFLTIALHLWVSVEGVPYCRPPEFAQGLRVDLHWLLVLVCARKIKRRENSQLSYAVRSHMQTLQMARIDPSHGGQRTHTGWWSLQWCSWCMHNPFVCGW